MTEKPPIGSERMILPNDAEITLFRTNSDNDLMKFKILEVLGNGGTAIAYKVEYKGSDNNRYLYVLKELYPLASKGKSCIRRFGKSLMIDEYEETTGQAHSYKNYRRQFEDAYRIQNDMANGNDAVMNMTTSLPIGLYEDRESSKKGNYSVYGLYQYNIGQTLKDYKESSLAELIAIQGQIAEVIRSYHDHGYLWFDIKEANVNVIGSGTVRSVSMFDFGSLVLKERLVNYNADNDQDLELSFSPTSSVLLLPNELESILSSNRVSGFAFVDVKKNEKMIRVLGKYGFQTDIFLLGSMLFKRLSGIAPTENDCEQLQQGTFDLDRFERLKEYPVRIKEKLKRILVNCLNYKDRDKRYSSIAEYMIDINELYLALENQEGLKYIKGNAREYVAHCCKQYLYKSLTGDTNGKFRHLKELQGRFDSRVSLWSEETNKEILPSVAINSSPSINGGEENNRLVFLYGDGGMGKSTALYDYMRQTASVTSIYIELSQYEFIDKDTPFIFSKIFNDICKKFVDAVGFIHEEELSRVKDILMESLCETDIEDPRPKYVLLLDGYNEISMKERGGFDTEIAAIIDTWKNCRIVITGRNIPTDNDGKKIETYDHFSRFKFVGISESDRERLIKDYFPGSFAKIRNDDRLWKILRIPMFMGMFLQFNKEQSSFVHTRGEILDQYITNKEKEVADHIASQQTGDPSKGSFRSFLVRYALPIVANEMDQQRSFWISNYNLVNNAEMAWTTYAKQRGLKIGRMLDIKVPDMPENFDDLTVHIITVEAGYFYKGEDGKYGLIHQYFKDYFAAKHIQNILDAAKALGDNEFSKEEQLKFIKDNGLDYTWSDDVCIMLGEIIGDYKNEPGYTEE